MNQYHRCTFKVDVEDVTMNPCYIFFAKIDQLIQAKVYLLEWIKKFISTMMGQELGVNSAKSLNVAGGIVGTCLIFTPLAPIGVLTLSANAVISLIISAGGWIATSIRSGNLQNNIALE
jgi:hypothetical protein